MRQLTLQRCARGTQQHVLLFQPAGTQQPRGWSSWPGRAAANVCVWHTAACAAGTDPSSKSHHQLPHPVAMHAFTNRKSRISAHLDSILHWVNSRVQNLEARVNAKQVEPLPNLQGHSLGMLLQPEVPAQALPAETALDRASSHAALQPCHYCCHLAFLKAAFCMHPGLRQMESSYGTLQHRAQQS